MSHVYGVVTAVPSGIQVLGEGGGQTTSWYLIKPLLFFQNKGSRTKLITGAQKV
jgi:hypothetical protein